MVIYNRVKMDQPVSKDQMAYLEKKVIKVQQAQLVYKAK